MAGSLATIALAATNDAPAVYPVESGVVVRLITAASSTAKLEISSDGWNWRPWAFGTQAASTTNNQTMTSKALVRATAVTGTATFEIDKAATAEPSARVLVGKGSPLNAVIAPMGTLYLRTDGAAATTLYLKTTGADAAGWTAVTSA